MLGVLPDCTATPQIINNKKSRNDIIPQCQRARNKNAQGNFAGKLLFSIYNDIVFFHDSASRVEVKWGDMEKKESWRAFLFGECPPVLCNLWICQDPDINPAK